MSSSVRKISIGIISTLSYLGISQGTIKSVDRYNTGDPVIHTKLPKLSITKFDGSFDHWLSFWNKFSAEIDATDLPAVTKFAYLKELLVTKYDRM